MEQARREAIERGTYFETLPPPQTCGCCPGEDRPRQKKQRKCDATNKKNTARSSVRKIQYAVRSKL